MISIYFLILMTINICRKVHCQTDQTDFGLIYEKTSNITVWSHCNKFALLYYAKTNYPSGCLIKCNLDPACYVLAVTTGWCNFYSPVSLLYLNISTRQNPVIYQKGPLLNFPMISDNLINYWPINNDLLDIISGSNLTIVSNVTFEADRFNNSNGALYINNGYLKVPKGYYFSPTDFTIMLWVKVVAITENARILDFGNGANSDNVFLSISDGLTGYPSMGVFNGSNETLVVANSQLQINEWTHLTAVLSSGLQIIYINGVEVANEPSYEVPARVLRKKCYIGKSGWTGSNYQYLNAYIDDFKIYNRALGIDEIQADMNG